MSDEKKYYCFCDCKGKYETMTKEQILTAIAQATGVDEVDPDAGFITKVKEKNGGNYVTFWVGTRAQFNAIESKETNCMYIISDDTTSADLLRTVEQMRDDCNEAAAQAADAAAKAAVGIERIVKEDGTLCVFYANGLAEAWLPYDASAVPYTEEIGGFYATPVIAIPYNNFLKQNLLEYPLICEVSVTATGDEDAQVFMIKCGAYNDTRTAKFRLLCTKKTTISTQMLAHVLFKWQETTW